MPTGSFFLGKMVVFWYSSGTIIPFYAYFSEIMRHCPKIVRVIVLCHSELDSESRGTDLYRFRLEGRNDKVEGYFTYARMTSLTSPAFVRLVTRLTTALLGKLLSMEFCLNLIGLSWHFRNCHRFENASVQTLGVVSSQYPQGILVRMPKFEQPIILDKGLKVCYITNIVSEEMRL